MNQKTNLPGKPSAARLSRLFFSLGILGLLAVSLAIGNQLAAKGPAIPQIPNSKGGSNIKIVYPSSTYLCVGGCKPHQNWILFYLPPGEVRMDSLRLKTSLFLAQILTVGIGGDRCPNEEKSGTNCVVMELSHRLLSVLTETGLVPLSQLRDTDNWWLEYTYER
jgi:hypothetical protein